MENERWNALSIKKYLIMFYFIIIFVMGLGCIDQQPKEVNVEPLPLTFSTYQLNQRTMEEIFKDIKGFKGHYQISNFGNVKSLKRHMFNGYKNIIIKERILRPGDNYRGYLMVILQKNNTKKTVKIHHLVFDHFGEGERNGQILQIDHIDNNKKNNRIDNLQLLSNRENCIKRSNNINKTSKYVGVYWRKDTKKWVAQIRINKIQKRLGQFTDEYKAHLVYEQEFKMIT